MAESNRDRNSQSSNAEADELQVGWRMAGLGMQVASEVLAGLLLGWLYDYWRGTAPIGATIGALTGIVVGLFSLIRGSMRLMKALDERHPVLRRTRNEPRNEPRTDPQPDAGHDDPTEDEPPIPHEQWKKQWDDDWNDDEHERDGDHDDYESSR